MPYLQTADVKLHYLQIEEAPAEPERDLVMVHGLAANLAFWYLRLAPRFAEHFRVTLFDLRGHGRSGRPPAGYTPGVMADDMATLLGDLGRDRIHLVGHSFGGLVALAYALRHPDKVESLVLADVNLGFLRRKQRIQEWRLWPKFKQRLEQAGVPIKEDEKEFGIRLLEYMARLQVEQPERAQEFQGVLSPFMGRGGIRGARQWLELMDNTSARRDLSREDGISQESLQNLHIPTLLMYGEYSQALPSAQLLQRIWPDAEFELVRGAGHFFPVARPEIFSRAAERFWNRVL